MEKPNIILVVFDTLRWDCFQKYIENDSPFNEKLKDFANFNLAFSPSSWTLPSHISLFTGLYPSEHGIHETEHSELEEIFRKARDYSGEFITKIASANGYRTVGISANPMISSLTGFEEKFDDFYNVNLGSFSGIRVSKTHSKIFQKIEYIASSALSTFRGYPKNKGYKISLSLFNKIMAFDKFFVFMNFMEMHDPYSNTILNDDNFIILDDLFGIKPLNEKQVNKSIEEYGLTHHIEIPRDHNNLSP